MLWVVRKLSMNQCTDIIWSRHCGTVSRHRHHRIQVKSWFPFSSFVCCNQSAVVSLALSFPSIPFGLEDGQNFGDSRRAVQRPSELQPQHRYPTIKPCSLSIQLPLVSSRSRHRVDRNRIAVTNGARPFLASGACSCVRTVSGRKVVLFSAQHILEARSH